MTKSNIVLIGMPGAGKSTLGVVLAKIANLGFLDADLAIQQQYGATLQTLIDERGAEGFIELEGDVLAGIEAERCVIATGGSAVYSASALERLREHGVIVYLEIAYEPLVERLGDLHERGVVMRGGAPAPSDEPASNTDDAKTGALRALYDERRPLYEAAADLRVNVDGLSITAAARKVGRQVQPLLSHRS